MEAASSKDACSDPETVVDDDKENGPGGFAVTPPGRPVIAKVIVPLKPFSKFTVMYWFWMAPPC